MNSSQRLEKLVSEQFKSQTELAEKMKISPSNLSRTISEGQITTAFISKLVKVLPDLNVNWLLFGKGKPLLAAAENIVNDKNGDYSGSAELIKQLRIENETMRGQISFLQDLIRRLQSSEIERSSP